MGSFNCFYFAGFSYHENCITGFSPAFSLWEKCFCGTGTWYKNILDRASLLSFLPSKTCHFMSMRRVMWIKETEDMVTFQGIHYLMVARHKLYKINHKEWFQCSKKKNKTRGRIKGLNKIRKKEAASVVIAGNWEAGVLGTRKDMVWAGDWRVQAQTARLSSGAVSWVDFCEFGLYLMKIRSKSMQM